MMDPATDLVFIGDRPAQLCALVLDAPLTYTGDKLDPFAVQRMVERYATNYYTSTHYRLTQPRIIVLSTGLTWAPKYDGMAAKQVNTLLNNRVFPPAIFVMPVSTRILLGHAINAKLRAVCESTQARRDHTWFLEPWFEGDVAYPAQPTPTEVLAMTRTIQAFVRMMSRS